MIVHYSTKYKLPGAVEMRDEYIRNPHLDIHQATADRSNGALNRHGGKGLNLGKFYGMGIETFAERIGKSQEEARSLYDLYDQIMPFVSRLTDLCKQTIWRNGYLTLLDGMRMHFNQWVPALVNGRLVQARARAKKPNVAPMILATNGTDSSSIAPTCTRP